MYAFHLSITYKDQMSMEATEAIVARNASVIYYAPL